MSAAQDAHSSRAARVRTSRVRLPSRRFRFAAVLAIFCAAAVCGYLAGGFLRFTQEVSAFGISEPKTRADGIVVLTGGALRIDQAIDLLKSGRAERLLISGVNRGTSIDTLARLTATDRRWFDCCVDLDYAALNTIGNAEMASRWASARGFDDLILVTSDYHMPRSLIEFARMPGVRSVTPYAVRRDDLWAATTIPSVPGLRILATEYAKLVATRLRSGVGLATHARLDSVIAGLDLSTTQGITRPATPRPDR